MKIKHFERILLITMLGCSVYINSLINGFVFDDFNFIVNNDFIKHWNNIFILLNPFYFLKVIPGIYGAARPVYLVSLIFDYSVWGLNPFGFHLTNLVFHLLNSALVYCLVYKITKNMHLGFLTGLLFTVHPIHTEAVDVISFRPDLMAAFFCLMGLVFYIDSVNSKNRTDKAVFFLLANIFYIFGVLSKEMAITLPLIFVLYDFCFRASDGAESNLKKFIGRLKWYAVYLVLIAVVLLFRMHRFNYNVPTIQGTSIYTNAADNIFTMSTVGALYMKLLVIPIKLCADYTCYTIFRSLAQPEVFVSITMIILALFSGFVIFKKKKFASFCVFWFFVTLIPVSNIIPLLNIAAERYLYFPSIGFCILFAMVFTGKTRWGTTVLLFFVILLYSAKTVSRNQIWADTYTLWAQTSSAYPDNVKARTNYASALYDNGGVDGAIKQYQEAIKTYNRIKPDVVCNMNMSVVHNYLAKAYYSKNLSRQAFDELNEAIKIDPEYFDNYNDMGTIYLEQRKYNKAIEYFEKGIKIAPGDPIIRKNLSYANYLKNKENSH